MPFLPPNQQRQSTEALSDQLSQNLPGRSSPSFQRRENYDRSGIGFLSLKERSRDNQFLLILSTELDAGSWWCSWAGKRSAWP